MKVLLNNEDITKLIDCVNISCGVDKFEKDGVICGKPNGFEVIEITFNETPQSKNMIIDGEVGISIKNDMYTDIYKARYKRTENNTMIFEIEDKFVRLRKEKKPNYYGEKGKWVYVEGLE